MTRASGLPSRGMSEGSSPAVECLASGDPATRDEGVRWGTDGDGHTDVLARVRDRRYHGLATRHLSPLFAARHLPASGAGGAWQL
ncbi:hypothetical protein ACFQHN_20335 [Natrialbaceae archaeon GCM10025896]